VRARKTAEKFRKILELKKRQLEKDPVLYLASAEDLSRVVRSIDHSISTAAIFGHNPGLTEFVNRYSNLKIDNVPTSGIVVLATESWVDIGTHEADMMWYDFPKSPGSSQS
jgi:phosphohistidine phosphatase